MHTEQFLAIATLISTLGAVLIGIINAFRIQNVHLSMNSRLDQLLDSARDVARAEGREAARVEYRDAEEAKKP